MSLQYQLRSMASLALISVFLIISISPITAKTAYEVLQDYDFPIGLLPNGATGYELDTETGKFAVYLNETCEYNIDSYRLKYMKTVTGVLEKDRMSGLRGIQVKVSFLWFWLNIVKVSRDGDVLHFTAGIGSADFALSRFAVAPSCGCGLDCETVDLQRIVNPNRFASSSSS